MKNAVLAWIASGCLAAAWLASAATSWGQTELQRLESRIRRQVNQPSAAAPAPSAPSEAVPAPPADARAGTATTGAASRPYLGVLADDSNEHGQGVRVLEVYPDGPAEKAGLRPRDLITHAGSTQVRAMSDLAAVLDRLSPGDRITFDVLRDGQTRELQVTLGRPSGSASAASPDTQPVPAPPKPSPPADAGPALPAPATAQPVTTQPATDAARLAALERRIEELDRRVKELEQALKAQKPAK